MRRVKKYITAGIFLICFVGLAAFYATAYRSHLLWQEQNQIFLNTSHWVETYFDRPAWLGCLAGDWLTQFYHNPTTGSVILTLAIACSSAILSILLRRLLPPAPAYVMTAVLTVLLVACSFSTSTTLAFYMCVAGGLSLALVNLKVPTGKDGHVDLSPLMVIPAYWAFGFGALITAFFVVLTILRRRMSLHIGRLWWLNASFAVILAAVTPAVLSGAYFLPYKKAILYPGIARPSLPDLESEKRLSIADAFHERDYEQAKRLATNMESPDDISAFYYYLSSALQDSLPDNLLKYPVKNLGTLTTIGETTPLQVINMMNDLYYELGDMTYAERAAMMRNVFSPRNRNLRMMRRLAEVNLVSGDTAAALKYLRILDRTHAYSGWSRIHMPGSTSPETEKEILRRRALSNNKDNIRLGDNCRNILLELLESNPQNTVALDYLLCTDLLLKDMDTFKMDYDTYCMDKGAPRNKRLYQEALMIYLAGTEAPEEDWNRYISDPRLPDAFRRYSERRGDPAFSGHYWFYFDRQ